MKSQSISVIVPVHNGAHYLPRCLDSLFNEQGENCEIIVVDDGSTDETGVVLKKYKDKYERLSVITFLSNQGVSAARNAGIIAAKSCYLLFVDSDDQLVAGAIPSLQEVVRRQDVDIVMFQYQHVIDGVSKQNEVVGRDQRFNLSMAADQRLAFEIFFGKLMAWNGLYKKENLKDILFAFLPNGEDVLFGAQVFCQSKKVMFSQSTFYRYFQNSGTASQRKNAKHCLSGIEVVCALYACAKQLSYYSRIRDILFRVLRCMSQGFILRVLFSVPREDRDQCWQVWFERMGSVFCNTDLVPPSQAFLYKWVFNARSKCLVYLFFWLPIQAKSIILSCSPIKKWWGHFREVTAKS